MSQLLDYQRQVLQMVENPPKGHIVSFQTVPTEECPLLLTKKYLCERFCGYVGRGRPNYDLLRAQVLTDAVCTAAGFNYQDYNRKSYFSAEHSRRLREILGI